MTFVRTALYLDFDNVFGGLLKVDPEAALQFAESPLAWVTRLSTSLTVDDQRRWLVLRCYMNPSGWVPDPRGGTDRLFFSRFRPHFTKAGFEVIDCPRLTNTKNAADIRLVVDAVDALSGSTRYDEFVIASGDSDMTPLIVRLRAADRRTTVVSPSDAAEAFTSVADRLFNAQQVLALVQGEQPDEETAEEDLLADSMELSNLTPQGPAVHTGAVHDRFREAVQTLYFEAEAPLNLAALSNHLRSVLGSSVAETGWYGWASLSKALVQLALPNARISTHHLWDNSRHQAPDDLTTRAEDLPEPVRKFCSLLSLPRLPQTVWSPLYNALEEYASTHRFNLTESTSWTRDKLKTQGVAVGRGAIAFVVRGASYGGRPLHRTPPPTAEEIAAAFVKNLFDRAEDIDIVLDEEEFHVVREWLSVTEAQTVVSGDQWQVAAQL